MSPTSLLKNMSQPLQPYSDFVASRFKNAEDTLKDITEKVSPAAIARLHAVIGMNTEWGEYVNSNNTENAIEELGDLLFYVEAYLQQLPVDITYLPYQPLGFEDPGVSTYSAAKGRIPLLTTTLLDFSKKEAIYCKQLNSTQRELADSAYLQLVADLETVAAFHGCTLDYLRQHNQEKLLKRYPTGYSNEAAQQRADKPQGE